MNALQVWSHDSTFKLNMMMSHLRQLRATGLRYPFERLFDPVWYVETYPDVAGFRDGPLSHYLLHGEAKGYRPNPLFDPVWYVETYPDVAGFRDGPLSHYLLHGEAEGRRPNPLFDPVWYVETHPDAAGFRDGPLSHYLLHGEAEGRRPNPLFDPVWYVETYADRGARPGHALAHYLSNHDRGDFDPSPIFDTALFRRSHEAEYGPGSSPLEDALDLLRAMNTDNRLPASPPPLPQYDEEGRRERLATRIGRIAFDHRTPLVSIIMPTLGKNARLLQRAVELVRNQTWENWQLMIIPDDEAAVNIAWLDKIDNDRVVVLPLSPPSQRGVSNARNRGVRASQGSIVAYLDDDNYWHSEMLRVCVDELQRGKIDVVYAHQLRLTPSGVVDLAVAYDEARLFLGNYIDMNSLVHRRHLFFQSGGFDPRLSRAVDWDYILTVAKIAPPTLIDAPLVFYDDFPRNCRISCSRNELDAYRFILNKHLLSRPGSGALMAHMSREEIAMLVRHAEGKTVAVEFGAGGSTMLLRACVTGEVHSVESDARWIEVVSSSTALAPPALSAWTPHHIDIGQTGGWGYPMSDEGRERYSDYSSAVFDRIANAPELVLIDGRFRVRCALEVIRRGIDATVFVHDFWTRPHYHVVLEFFDQVETAENAVVLRPRRGIDFERLNVMCQNTQFDPR